MVEVYPCSKHVSTAGDVRGVPIRAVGTQPGLGVYPQSKSRAQAPSGASSPGLSPPPPPAAGPVSSLA